MKKIVLTLLSGLVMAGCASKSGLNADSVYGYWTIDNAKGMSTEKGENPAFINFDKDGKVHGNATVNLFNGDYSLKGEDITFSHMGMTMMMGQSMDVERAITDALNDAKTIKVDGHTATIYNSKKEMVMKLTKTDKAPEAK